MGLGLQLGFGTIAAVSLKPMMCYKHPNGRYSVLSYPTIFCGEDGHGLLLAFGIGLLTLFVLGFLVVCSYAVWNLPRWSVEGKHGKVQSFRFCTSNFRLDSYGFIIPLLCRGLGFAVSIVVGTNLPPVQTGLVSIVLVAYTVVQASLRPWKAPAINLADTVLSASLLILASRSLQEDGDMEAKLGEHFTVIILMLLLACLASLAVLCIVGVIVQLVGGNWNRILALGSGSQDPAKISEALKQCAHALLEIENAYLREKIASINSYDVIAILNFINVIGADFQDENRTALAPALNFSQGSGIVGSRVRMVTINARLSTSAGAVDPSSSIAAQEPQPQPEPPTPGNDDLPALSEAQEPPKHNNQGIASNDPTAESPDVAQGDPGDAKSKIVSTVF